MTSKNKKVQFTRLDHATVEDFNLIMPGMQKLISDLPNNILDLLIQQKGAIDNFPVNRYEHCLQTATRAYRDNADEEMIVIALLHDVAISIAPFNHDEVAASLLKPYISEDNYWLVKHHGTFQGFYFWDKIGQDKFAREKFKNHKMYSKTIEFCERWDNLAFDPDYNSLPLSFFEPMVKRIFSRSSKNQSHVKSE